VNSPTQPQTPQTISREFTRGGPGLLPVVTSVSSITPIFPNTWQIGGVFVQNVSVPVPALSSGASETLSFNVSLAQNSSFSSIVLVKNQSAAIIPVVYETTSSATEPAYVCALPKITLSFSGGASSPPATPGQPLLFSGAATYTTPTLSISLQVTATAAVAATTLSLMVVAVLVGTSS
jgi:hypothetical protein